MPAQSPIPDRPDPAFGLIETMLFTRGEGIFLLEAHLARLAASALHFSLPHDGEVIRARLLAHVGSAEGYRLRIRLVLGRDGGLTLQSASLLAPEPGLFWRVTITKSRFYSGEPLLLHKTTLRDRYEIPLAIAATDEVVFLNERGELCEGARSNIFVARGGKLLTPPLSSGLLPGTLRAHLLAEGQAEEAMLTAADLAGEAMWFMGNSVRGLVRTKLASSGTG